MLKRTGVVAAAAGLALLATPAQADSTSGEQGVLSGNQVGIPIVAPVNVCGNAVAVLGLAKAGCKGGALVKHKHKHH